MDTDSDSSGLDFEEIPNPYAYLGLKSVQSIIDRATEDRIESKKRFRQLHNTLGAPKTALGNNLWYNRFLAFYQITLGRDVKETPGGYDVERFIGSIFHHIEPRHDIGAPSIRTVLGGLSGLQNSLTFYYPDFNLTAHHKMRISTTIDELEKNGILTSEPKREKQWVSAYMVKRLVAVHLTDAIETGTRSWDVTVSKALSVVLLAALACRSGEVGHSQYYDNLACLCFKDITIKIDNRDREAQHDNDSVINRLQARVVLRFEKFKKRSPENREVTLTSLKDNVNNCVCPIKLLLAHTLRAGYLLGDTIEDVLNNARRNRDTIEWVSSAVNLPVISSIKEAGSDLRRDMSANTNQLGNTVHDMGVLAGLLVEIRAHDIRRGAIRDIAYLPESNAGIATPSVAAAAGHSDAARRKGVTQSYIGPQREDNWSKRVAAGAASPQEVFTPAFADNTQRKRRLKPEEVTKWCVENGKDPTTDRRVAQIELHKAREEIFFSGASPPLADNPRPSADRKKPPQPPKTTSKKRKIDPSQRKITSFFGVKEDHRLQLQPSSYLSDVSAEEDTASQASTSIHEAPAYVGPSSLPSSSTLEATGSDEPTEDELSLRTLESALQNIEDSLFETSGPGSEQMALEFIGEASYHVNDCLIQNPVAFVTWLSRINSVKGLSTQREGGSKGAGSIFMHQCTNRIHGCNYENARPDVAAQHSRRCTITAVITPRQKPHPCLVEGCNSSFDGKWELQNHMKRHDWVPKGCPELDCDTGKIYGTKATFDKHRSDAHGSYRSKLCGFPGCTNTTMWKTRGAHGQHLERTHHVIRKDQLQYLYPERD